MGGDFCSRCREFESQHQILDGHFFEVVICCKTCFVGLEKTENKRKRGRRWSIWKQTWLWCLAEVYKIDFVKNWFRSLNSRFYYLTPRTFEVWNEEGAIHQILASIEFPDTKGVSFLFCFSTVRRSCSTVQVQCDQIWQFFALWATIQSRWQQLIYTNHPHC